MRFDVFWRISTCLMVKKMIKLKKILFSRWFSLSKIWTETKSWDNRTIRTWKFNVLKSAGFRCLVLQMSSVNLLFFASPVLIIPIPNPKHQRLGWSNFFMDLANDAPKICWIFPFSKEKLNDNIYILWQARKCLSFLLNCVAWNPNKLPTNSACRNIWLEFS